MRQQLLIGLRITCLLFAMSSSHAAEDGKIQNAWKQLQEGTAVAIMRHALAPGTGDPSNFVLDDCATQRNLSAQGKAQARAIGDLFREHGITSAQIFTSEWCRCQETARLLDFDAPEPFPPLNSFFQNRQSAEGQTSRLREALPEWMEQGSTPTLLVTHQVNIRALTGSFTSSGEILIISLVDDELIVLANIATLD